MDEVKTIRDKAQAMAAYAKQARDTQMVQWATAKATAGAVTSAHMMRLT